MGLEAIRRLSTRRGRLERPRCQAERGDESKVSPVIDKFCYHLPLYRQHQRLLQSGIQLSRSSLCIWAGRAIDWLRPIVNAQAQHLLQSRVLAIDEMPIKAGRQGKGKLRQAYFWPIYGEDDEIIFHYVLSRAHRPVEAFLRGFSATLLSDGYDAYEAYTGKTRCRSLHLRGRCDAAHQ